MIENQIFSRPAFSTPVHVQETLRVYTFEVEGYILRGEIRLIDREYTYRVLLSGIEITQEALGQGLVVWMREQA